MVSMDEANPETPTPYALRLAYDGRAFHGSTVQPGITTIEGCLRKCLERAKIIQKNSPIRFASRTDAGVSALGNVVVIETTLHRDAIAPLANKLLENIWIIGVSPVSSAFNSRHARLRWYRYFLLKDGIDLELAKSAASLFVGRHDFSNFARVEAEKNPVRTLDSIEMSESGHFLLFDIKGQTFLWNMVRRIMSAVRSAGLGKISLSDIQRALMVEVKVDLGLAPSENLVLMDISYANVSFEKLESPGVMKDVTKHLVASRLKTSFFETLMEKV